MKKLSRFFLLLFTIATFTTSCRETKENEVEDTVEDVADDVEDAVD